MSPSSAANEVLATVSVSSGSDPWAKEDVLATGSGSSIPLLRAVNFSGARLKVWRSGLSGSDGSGGSDPGAKEDVLATDVLTGCDPGAKEDVLATDVLTCCDPGVEGTCWQQTC